MKDKVIGSSDVTTDGLLLVEVHCLLIGSGDSRPQLGSSLGSLIGFSLDYSLGTSLESSLVFA